MIAYEAEGDNELRKSYSIVRAVIVIITATATSQESKKAMLQVRISVVVSLYAYKPPFNLFVPSISVSRSWSANQRHKSHLQLFASNITI